MSGECTTCHLYTRYKILLRFQDYMLPSLLSPEKSIIKLNHLESCFNTPIWNTPQATKPLPTREKFWESSMNGGRAVGGTG